MLLRLVYEDMLTWKMKILKYKLMIRIFVETIYVKNICLNKPRLPFVKHLSCPYTRVNGQKTNIDKRYLQFFVLISRLKS